MNRLLLKRKALPFYAILLGLCLALFPRGASAAMEGYCQYPPYVRQSVLPSVTLLVSNSVSMLQFAYGDVGNPASACDSDLNACAGFDPTKTYYGLFDPAYWYTGTTGNNGGFTKAAAAGGTALAPTGRGNNDWHGNFLNWLTSRRIDVMRKVLTGGTGDGTQLCGNGVAEWKKFTDNGTYSPVTAVNQIVHFPKSINCSGTLLGQFVLGTGTTPFYPIRNKSAGTTSGIIQEMTPKASLGIAFYNSSDAQGGSLDPQVDGSNLPISAYRNRIDTPSNFNGITPGAPLGEALWTVVGSYMRDSAVDSTYGPRYHNSDYNANKDPYAFHGAPSRCVKGSVIVISDGEPCGDGSLPAGVEDFAGGQNSRLNCQGDACLEATEFHPTFTATTIPSCAAGGAVAGVEDVALLAHTTDLRNAPVVGVDNVFGDQTLDFYFIRAFGRDTSNLLKYAAINGTFEDAPPRNFIPDPGEYSLSTAYAEAEDGFAIANAVRNIFENLLRRATSGTAASVLASGQGSGANLVQAVFYPRRRFFDEVIEWTGTLQNFWYYVDPFLGNSSIREESQRDTDIAAGLPHTLNLVSDKTLSFFFDTTSGTTKANRYSNDPTTGNATETATEIPFEEAMSIWEAGKFLHLQNPGVRRIYTVTDNVNYGTPLIADGNAFATTRASSLAPFLGVSDTSDAQNIISYVQGYDLAGFRQRTVPYPANTATDNTVWKLGDVINSTPRVVASIPLNTYQKTYNDLTYDAFTKTDPYKNRGMVFVGANDGMLHAFKLGKLEFPGDAGWSSPGTWDKARLRNLSSTTTGALGSERWAFVPKNALPYLQALGDNTYCHLYYVDLAPQVFDASINGADNAVRTADSWRTVLIGGMRLGGGCASPGSGRSNAVDIPISGVGYSSYFAIDVTNPEAPSVLWEFSDPALGFATTGPAVVRMNARNASNNPDRTLNGKWYVVFGSGPTGPISDRQFLAKSDQPLRLFVVDLKTGALARTPIEQFTGSTISNAFAGSLLNSTADVDLDYQDDVLYFGYVKKENSGTSWNQGGVARLQMNGSPDPNAWTASKVLDNIGPVTSSVARLQNNILHTNWLFFGTGRYFFALPSTQDDPTTGRTLYGVKDRCFNSMNTMTPNCTLAVDPPAIDAETPPSEEPAGGWFINLDTDEFADYDGTGQDLQYDAERVITDPLATSSGVVFFTSYRPYGEDCSIGGRTFLWAVQYNTGGAPAIALRGKVLMQVSTASVEQVDLSTAFSGAASRGGRRSYSLEGVPPMAQGLSLLSPPPPVKRLLHIRER